MITIFRDHIHTHTHMHVYGIFGLCARNFMCFQQAYVWCTIYTCIIKWFSRSKRMMYTFFSIDVDGDNSDHLWGAAWGFAALQRTSPWLGTNMGRALAVGKISENAGKMRDSNLTRVIGCMLFSLFFSKKSRVWVVLPYCFLSKVCRFLCRFIPAGPSPSAVFFPQNWRIFCTEDAEPPGWDRTNICKFWQSEAPSSSEQGWVDARGNDCLVRACNPVNKQRTLKFHLTI